MAKVLVENDTCTKTNDDGPSHASGGGEFDIPGSHSLVQRFVRIIGKPVLVQTQTFSDGCCYGTLGVPSSTCQQQYVRINGKLVLLEHDKGTGFGPHTITDTTSHGQNFVKITP